MSFAKERPKSAGPGGPKSPLMTSRNFKPSELSSLTASFVPERKDSKLLFCSHNNPKLKTNTMSDRKKQSLENIKRREEIRATRSRLRGVLLQKLLQKFGNLNKDKITKHVDHFVDSKLQITADDLVNLEKTISDDTTTPPPPQPAPQDPASLNLPINNLTGKQQRRPASAGSSRGSHRGTCACGCSGCGYGHDKCVTPIPLGSEWHALEVYQSIKDIESMRNEETLRKQKQREMSAVLREQMKEIEERRKRDKEEDLKYLQAVHEDLKKFSVEGEELLQKQKDKYEKNRNIWTQQLEDKKEAQRRHQEELKAAEQEELARINAALEKEKARLAAKKQEELQKHQERLLENQQKLEQKELEKKMNQEENRRYAKEYNDRIEKEERERQALLQKRLDNIEKYVQWIDEGPVGQQKRLEEKAEEERIVKYQEMKEISDAEKEEKKLERARERQRLMNLENERMLREKEEKKKREREEGQEEKLKAKEISEENRAAILKRREAEMAEQMRYHKVLTQQIYDKHWKSYDEDMNGIERALNKDDLKTIKCNPTFHSKVYSRLKTRVAAAAAAQENGERGNGNGHGGPTRPRSANSATGSR